MTDSDALECATCGHVRRFHTDVVRRGGAHTPEERPCSSPEDGAPCTCPGFEPIQD
jgi:hypothetical protein